VKVLIAAAVQTCCKTPLHKYTTSTEFLDRYFIYKQIQLLLHSRHILHFTDGWVFCFKELLGFLRWRMARLSARRRKEKKWCAGAQDNRFV